MTLTPEEIRRRPGIEKLVERVRREYPKMTLNGAIARAKVLYHSAEIAVWAEDHYVRVKNPDYMAARDQS